MLDIVGKRYWYFTISLIIIVPGLISLLIWGLPLGIDFTGGTLWQVQFPAIESPIQPAEAKLLFTERGYTDALVQTSTTTKPDDTLVIRAKQVTPEDKAALTAELKAKFGGEMVEQRFDSVGPAVGQEVAQRATLAVILAAAAILLYITFAFRHVPSPFRYGTAAVISLIHDALAVLGLASLAGHFLGLEVDALFLTALMTVIGFSVHDTIVVFDRVRENIVRYRGQRFETIVNRSIIETLTRSLNTQLTVLFTLTALLLLGGATIQHFVATLLIGILLGTYSSIFNAAPILVVWENGEVGQFFRRLFGRRSAATT